MHRGWEGVWAFWGHRISGVGMALFLGLHVMDTMLLAWGPRVYNAVMAWFNTVPVKGLEFLLVAAVIYHAVNGVRIMILDLWPTLCSAIRLMLWIQTAIVLLLYLPISYFMFKALLI